MKCFLCSNEIVYSSDDFKHTMWGRTGHVQISRTNYICLNCQELEITVDLPAEELISFRVYLGKGYTLKGHRDDTIQIIYSKDKDDKVVHLPWIHVAGFKNIISQLSELSEKYEIYVTFS